MARVVPTRKYVIPAMFAAAAGSALVIEVSTPPAQALVVFDPSNYSQNILTAARTLQQISNQVRMLQNQAQGLVNQGKNLARIGFPELSALRDTIQQIDGLMGEARAIQFRVASLDEQFRSMFPRSFDQTLTIDRRLSDARARFDASMDAYRHTMTVQAKVVENVAADAGALDGVVRRSQDAEGALQASQATNQLLALVAKQQFQIQTLMAAQYRADAIERANRAQAQGDAQGATAKFLGSGTAYTPH